MKFAVAALFGFGLDVAFDSCGNISRAYLFLRRTFLWVFRTFLWMLRMLLGTDQCRRREEQPDGCRHDESCDHTEFLRFLGSFTWMFR